MWRNVDGDAVEEAKKRTVISWSLLREKGNRHPLIESCQRLKGLKKGRKKKCVALDNGKLWRIGCKVAELLLCSHLSNVVRGRLTETYLQMSNGKAFIKFNPISDLSAPWTDWLSICNVPDGIINKHTEENQQGYAREDINLGILWNWLPCPISVVSTVCHWQSQWWRKGALRRGRHNGACHKKYYAPPKISQLAETSGGSCNNSTGKSSLNLQSLPLIGIPWLPLKPCQWRFRGVGGRNATRALGHVITCQIPGCVGLVELAKAPQTCQGKGERKIGKRERESEITGERKTAKQQHCKSRPRVRRAHVATNTVAGGAMP